MIKIVADSSCDLMELPGVEFQSAPLTIYTEERSFRDDRNLNLSGMLDYLAQFNGRSYTACPNAEDWVQAFGGADTVYAVTMTSALSGSYNAAAAARTLYLQEQPKAKVQVFDTLSTGPEIRLLVEKLAEWIRQGLDFEQICVKARAYMQRSHLFFVLQSVHNLSQNGRISKVAAAAVNVLGIRILGYASPQGTIEPIAKCRSDRRALSGLMEQLERLGFSGGKLRLSHVENQPLAERLRQMLIQRYPQADILVYPSRGLCSYYAERGAILLGVEV